MSKPAKIGTAGAGSRVFSSAEYTANPGAVIDQARRSGIAVVADDGVTRMVVSIPTHDLKTK